METLRFFPQGGGSNKTDFNVMLFLDGPYNLLFISFHLKVYLEVYCILCLVDFDIKDGSTLHIVEMRLSKVASYSDIDVKTLVVQNHAMFATLDGKDGEVGKHGIFCDLMETMEK